MEMIAAEGLTKYYRKFLAVDHVSFVVEEGEVFGFLGPNGAGKTTTIKMLNTLIRIGEGRARVAGYDVAKHGREVREVIGLVPQEMTLDRDMTGWRNLWIQARLYDVPEDEAGRRIGELLDLVDLQAVSQKPVGTYSWGMQRRLEIALGLVHRPRILFMDEPTLGLDATTRLLIWEYIRKLRRDLNVTIFLTTHYLEEADDLCDRIAIISSGKIKAAGTPDQLKRALGGDLVTMRLVTPADEARVESILGPLEGVLRVSREEGSILVETTNGEETVPRLIEALTERGVQVKSVGVRERTLNEVFTTQVGGTLSSDEQEDARSLMARERLLRETRS